MARVDKVADDGGADETGRAGNENTHDALLPDGPASRTGRYFQVAHHDRGTSKTCSGPGDTFQASPQLILIY
jgi:hypothetical protein